MSDDTPPSPSRRALIAGAAILASASRARAEPAPAKKHVVLLGDSIFDNKAYVGDGPDVIQQLREALPTGWSATLGAVDGSVTADVKGQIARLPAGATHLVVSSGGNDALQYKEILEEKSRSVGEALDKLSKVRAAFTETYAAMIDAVTRTKLPVVVCTIYDSNYEDADERRIGNTGLTIFNDVITRQAFARRLPLIDLRLVFDSPADYANPIEPSVKGGAKLAHVIAEVVTTHDFKMRRSEVYGA
ncbi:MAG: SGNH/GDSL hydrolase family protein [Methyloceanibacter sp.]|uniref:SGNH/GDSL hydrolase family protein n=1 Tax=Methyloceanibacter sp. TaxID=1965321 RepID=UPI003D6C7124